MRLTSKTLSAGAVILLLFLAGCGSSGIGDILGGGNQQPSNSNGEVRGTVNQVDTQNGSIVLTNVDSGTYGQSSGSSVRVYFDNQTQVTYQGRSYRPQDLERGDEISAQVQQSGNRLIATSMTVTYDARGGGSTGSSNGYPSGGSSVNSVRGTVRNVDTSRRTIDVDQGYNGQTVTVAYDNNTSVASNGRQLRASDLQRGDEVDVRGRNSGGRLLADSIDLIRNDNGGGTYGGGSNGTYGSTSSVRGTVRYVDTGRRTIELEQATWQNFDTRSGNSGNSVVVVQYDNSTQVEYQGQTYTPSNLERGDVIDVQLRRNGGSDYLADRITVVRDVHSR